MPKYIDVANATFTLPEGASPDFMDGVLYALDALCALDVESGIVIVREDKEEST